MAFNLSPTMPAKVAVYFPARCCNCEPDGRGSHPDPYYISEVELSSITLTISIYAEETTGFEPDGVAGRTKVFHSSAPALYDPGGTDPTNKDALDDLARQIAQDFYDWMSVADDTVWNGIVPFTPTGIYDEVIFTHTGSSYSRSSGVYGNEKYEYTQDDITTRTRSMPFHGAYAEELQHFDPAAEPCRGKRQLVLIPTVTRVGNHLRIPKAWLSAVQVAWHGGAIDLIESTTDPDFVFICCGSSSSTSTSDDCPGGSPCKTGDYEPAPWATPNCCRCGAPKFFKVTMGTGASGTCVSDGQEATLESVGSPPCQWNYSLAGLAIVLTVIGLNPAIVHVSIGCTTGGANYESTFPSNDCLCEVTLPKIGQSGMGTFPDSVSIEPVYI